MRKKILIFGMNDNPGGVERFLLNYYTHINHEKIEFDFLCNYPKVAYEEKLLERGAKVFHITARSKNVFKYYMEINRFFKTKGKDYDAIWVNVSSLANIDYLKLAKKYGIKRRIVHSHSSKNMDSEVRGKLHSYNKKRIFRFATDFWACSSDAAKWFFEGQALEQSVIIPNAIKVDDYKYDENKAKKILEAYGLESSYVIGNVGRFSAPKNHPFLINVFSKLIKKLPEARLVLVGQGPDEEMLKNQVEKLGLTGQVIFAGVQSDIQAWLSSFDLFFFPSKFEGLSLAALEAQANGVPTLSSKGVITEELKIVENFEFFELSKSEEQWAEKIIEMKISHTRVHSEEILDSFKSVGYELSLASSLLEEKLLTD